MTGEVTEKTYCFKKENKFIVKSGCKKRMWRSLKQILTAERSLPWPNEAVLYYSINAPPTFKPTKKYSDISGLPAPYMDRHSKLFYSNAEEFATVRNLPMDITAGYLQLRGANTIFVNIILYVRGLAKPITLPWSGIQFVESQGMNNKSGVRYTSKMMSKFGIAVYQIIISLAPVNV